MNQSFQRSIPQRQLSNTEIKQLCLYNVSSFKLPVSLEIVLNPFESQETLPSKSFEQLIPFKTYKYAYNTQYQAIMNNIKYIPTCITVNQKYVVVATKTEFLIFDNPNDFNSYKKISLEDVITCLDIRDDVLLIGTKSGKILYFFLNKKVISCEINYLKNNITKLKLITPNRLAAIDFIGNFIFFDINLKIIMDKIFLINTNSTAIYEQKQTRTFSKLWKNLVSKETSSQQLQINIFSTFAIMGERYKSFLLKNELITAVCRKNLIKILILNQDKLTIKDQQTLFQIKSDQEIGIFTFGMSQFDYPNQSNLLFVVSIGKTIHYFKLIRTDYNDSWYQVYKVQCQNHIYDGEFLSNNLITYITESGVQISSVGEELQLITEMDCRILLQINSQKNKFQVFKNLLGISWDRSKFFCLQEKKIIIGEVQSWQNYLKAFTHDFKSEDAMSYALMIYNGKIKILAGIKQNISQRHQQMRVYFSNIVFSYVKFEMKNHPDQIKRTLTKCFQFTIDTQNHQYLFTTIYDSVFNNEKYKTQFFIVMEEFIKMKKVTYINRKVLEDCIQVYRKLNKMNSIQTLIINLDFNIVDKSSIFEICLQYQLYKSLIHLSVIQEDFITPIVKICGKISMQPEIKTDQIKRGQIIFWYIKNCLEGGYAQLMTNAKYIQMLQKIITYIFLPVTLKVMCKTNPQYFFRIIQGIFEMKAFQLILQNSEKMIMKKNSFTNKKIFESETRAEFHVYQQILKNIIFTQYFHTEIAEYYLNKFLTITILKNHFPFDITYKIRAAKFFIQNPKIFHNRTIILQQEEEIINSYLLRVFDSIFCKCTQKETQELHTILASYIEGSKHRELFSESLCYLYHLNRNFKKCFEIYFGMKNELIRNKIILYLESNIYLKDIHPVILDNLINLISINQSKILNLLAAYLEEDALNIVQKLKQFPTLQLNFFQIVLKTKPNPSDQFKIAHLKTALIYDANSVDHFLKRIDYPLDQAQQICYQFNHKPGIARIYCKKGDTEQGILKMIQIFYESFDMIIRNPQSNQTEKQNLNYRLNEILQICTNQYKKNNQKGEIIWQKCIQTIFKQRILNLQQIINEKTHILNQFISEMLKRILFSICTQISIQFFLEKLMNNNNIKYLNLNIFNQPFFKIFSRIFYARTLFKYTKDLLQQNVVTNSQLIYQAYTKGRLIDICHYCNQQILLESNILLFKCGHKFHNQCNKKQQCILCKNKSCFIFFQDAKKKQEIILKKVFFPVKENIINDEQHQFPKSKKQRLKYFQSALNQIDANTEVYLQGQLPHRVKQNQPKYNYSSLKQKYNLTVIQNLNSPKKKIRILDEQDTNPTQQEIIIIDSKQEKQQTD